MLKPAPSNQLSPSQTDCSQYAHRRVDGWRVNHRQLIKDYRLIQSMSRTATCWDNSAMESFFETLTVQLLRYDTRVRAKLDIVDWIEVFCNHKRMHSSIGYNRPITSQC